MKKYWKIYTAFLCAALTAILCSPFNAAAAEQPANTPERIVILAPAAADILFQLGCSDNVVGVTDSIEEFAGTEKVGTHINPCIECIAALKPTLLVTTGKFPADLAARLKAERYVYEPQDLQEILGAMDALGKRLGKNEKANEMIGLYSGMIQNLRPPRPLKTLPKVLYETRSVPLTLAGKDTIMKDALERAGFRFLRAENPTGQVSAEYVLRSRADFYIYQVGPMNMNPIPPKEREGWKKLKACVWKVDEKIFARPNTKIFAEIAKINIILDSDNPCEMGEKEGYKP